MSLCYDHYVWGPFQWKMGIVRNHRIILECLCSFKSVFTVWGLPSVNKFLMSKHVRACAFSCFDTQIVCTFTNKQEEKTEKTLFLPMLTFSPTSSLVLLNSFEWQKYVQQNNRLNACTFAPPGARHHSRTLWTIVVHEGAKIYKRPRSSSHM